MTATGCLLVNGRCTTAAEVVGGMMTRSFDVPSPGWHVYWTRLTLLAVDRPGTSRHRPEPAPMKRMVGRSGCDSMYHVSLAPVVQVYWISDALLAVEAPYTVRHLPEPTFWIQ